MMEEFWLFVFRPRSTFFFLFRFWSFFFPHSVFLSFSSSSFFLSFFSLFSLFFPLLLKDYIADPAGIGSLYCRSVLFV
jgi:hypothetical protein